MTNDGQIDSIPEHVLHAPLAPEQLALLEAVWETVPAGAPAWPVWDYVARVLYRRSPPVTKPAALLRSLPVLPNADFGNPYGLTWRTELSTQSPAPNTRVGLSIAGLHALRSRDPRAGRLADLAATLIGDLASKEREVDPDPTGPVEVRADLDTRIGTLRSGADELAGITLDAVSELLRREFAPLAIEPGEAGRPVAVLRMQLAPYDSVRSAETYLDLIASELPRRVRHPVWGPDLIPLTLDYLSVILANDPRWASGPLVAAPDLRSASTIAMAVRDEVEFRDRMSALASILERLNVPHVGEPELGTKYRGRQPNSVTRLGSWLETHLAGQPGLTRALSAIGDVRAVQRLRVEGQHSTPELRLEAAQARLRLGLPEVVFDWAEAWYLIRSRVAEAFDIIRQEVVFAAPGLDPAVNDQ